MDWWMTSYLATTQTIIRLFSFFLLILLCLWFSRPKYTMPQQSVTCLCACVCVCVCVCACARVCVHLNLCCLYLYTLSALGHFGVDALRAIIILLHYFFIRPFHSFAMIGRHWLLLASLAVMGRRRESGMTKWRQRGVSWRQQTTGTQWYQPNASEIWTEFRTIFYFLSLHD